MKPRNQIDPYLTKPKVLLLGKLFSPYMGAAIATQILLNSSLTKHYTLLHLDTAAYKPQHLIMSGVWGLRRTWQKIGIYIKFISLVLKEKPEVVLVPFDHLAKGFWGDALFVFLCNVLRRKVLLQMRSSHAENWAVRANWFSRFLAERSLRAADGIIVLGRRLRHLFGDYFSKDRIFIVPNGANYPRIQTSYTARNSELRLLHQANPLPSKGIEDVLAAIKELKKRGVTGFRLDIVGNWMDDRFIRTYLHMIESHGLPARIHGAATDSLKFRLLLEADLFVYTSHAYEGHPWQLTEALAAGLPIIATDEGAVSESVINGVNGFIVPQNSPRRIADKIAILGKQPQLLDEFSHASRAHYLNNFTEEKMVERLVKAIDKVLPASIRQLV